MIEAKPGATFHAILDNAATGLAGTLTFELVRVSDDNVEIAESTTGIVELDTPGVYRKTATAPATEGDYLIIWRSGSESATETLTVTATANQDDPYFTVAEFRDRYPDIVASSPSSNQIAKTDVEIETARALAEEAFEHACEVAFVPRTETEKTGGYNSPALILKWPRIRSITSLTVSGTDFTADQLTALEFGSGSVVSYATSSGYFTAGNGNVTVTYEHGYDSPPLEVVDAVMVLTRDKLIQGPVSDRRTSLPTENGPIGLARPGIDPDHPFGLDEVDSVYQRYNERTYIA